MRVLLSLALGLAPFPAIGGFRSGSDVTADQAVGWSSAFIPGGGHYYVGGDPFRLPETNAATAVRLAHAILVKATPEKESVLTDVPQEVLLVFNDPVGEAFLALAVVDAAGKRVDKHDAKLDFTDRSHLRASVEKLVPGRYMVRYRVLSADGHVVSGKYFFDVKGQ